METKFVTTREACAILRVHRNTLKKFVDVGKITRHLLAPRIVRYSTKELHEFMCQAK